MDCIVSNRFCNNKFACAEGTFACIARGSGVGAVRGSLLSTVLVRKAYYASGGAQNF